MAWQPLLDTVQYVPGAEGAAFSTVMPIKHPLEWLTIVYKTDWSQDNVDAAIRAASPGLMEVLSVRMRSGRFLNQGDKATSLPVTVVNRIFTRTRTWLSGSRHLNEAVEDSIGAQKLAAEVLVLFGGLALLITVVGLYGLLSYLVEQRTREIGVRMALGASRGAVAGMVMRQTVVLMTAGVAIGLGLVLWSQRLLHGSCTA